MICVKAKYFLYKSDIVLLLPDLAKALSRLINTLKLTINYSLTKTIFS